MTPLYFEIEYIRNMKRSFAARSIDKKITRYYLRLALVDALGKACILSLSECRLVISKITRSNKI